MILGIRDLGKGTFVVSLLNTDRARSDHRHNSIQVALGELMVKRIVDRNLGDTGIYLREKLRPSNEGHSWKIISVVPCADDRRLPGRYSLPPHNWSVLM